MVKVCPLVVCPLVVYQLDPNQKKPRKKKEAVVVAAPNDNPNEIQSDEVGAGLSAGAKPKKPRKPRTKKTGGDLKDVLDTAASVAKTVAPFAPLLLGLGHEEPKGDGHKTRSERVKEIMGEKKLSLIEASTYVKEHGLYKPKIKGAALLTLKSADFVGDTVGPVSIQAGGVKPLKGRGKATAKSKV